MWAWLLDNLPAAAASADFGPQAVANTLAALVKLDALSPSLLHALHVPLLRVLEQSCSGSAAAGGAGLTGRGLTQVLWALGREAAARPLLLAVKPQLFQALWTAAPSLDAQVGAALWVIWGAALAVSCLLCTAACGPLCCRHHCKCLPECKRHQPDLGCCHFFLSLLPFSILPQGIATAWFALGEASSRCLLEELDLERETPTLLPRLAAAMRAAAPAMTFHGLAQVGA